MKIDARPSDFFERISAGGREFKDGKIVPGVFGGDIDGKIEGSAVIRGHRLIEFLHVDEHGGVDSIAAIYNIRGCPARIVL